MQTDEGMSNHVLAEPKYPETRNIAQCNYT
jgi:hypothetical protein